MSKIKNAFENGKAFIAFITCGDPDLETTDKAVRAAVENGASLIELGIPFSDPTAEGPIVQSANIRALNGGVTADKIFDFVKELRKDISVPVVFVTYANVIFSYGTEKFLSACKDVEADGLIIPDVPYEENDDFLPVCRKYGIDLISLIAYTSENRIAKIAKNAEGFIYITYPPCATGKEEQANADLKKMIKLAREYTDIPCAVDCGISAPEQAEKAASISDGVIVGTEIVKIIGEYGKDSPEYVGEYVKKMTERIK